MSRGGGTSGRDDVLVRLDRVGRRFARGTTTVHALADVSLEVRRGEMVALVGPSGCGKSTCLNVISGVDRPDSGEAHVLGIDLGRAREAELVLLRRRRIGIVFQAFHLVPHLSVAENVALPLALDGRRDPARVAELLAAVGLAHRATHFPGELSGGEEQRTAVARALAHRPELVVADEPTGNLDSASGAAVLELLDRLRRESGAALVIATHDATIAARADRVVQLADGRIAGAAGAADKGSAGVAGEAGARS
jgi:putative ABC transport system ATP-binding protein